MLRERSQKRILNFGLAILQRHIMTNRKLILYQFAKTIHSNGSTDHLPNCQHQKRSSRENTLNESIIIISPPNQIKSIQHHTYQYRQWLELTVGRQQRLSCSLEVSIRQRLERCPVLSKLMYVKQSFSVIAPFLK